MWYSLISSMKNNRFRNSKVIVQYLIMLVALNATLTLTYIMQLYYVIYGLKENDIAISNIVTFSIGFVTAAGRLSNKNLLREIF